MKKINRQVVPSIFTIFNLFFGFLAILQIFQKHYITAVLLIFFAGLFDVIDGKVARWLNNDSQFGIEMDSLADGISFCLAPSILIYDVYAADLGLLGALISFFPLLFGVIRLAKYNLKADSAANRQFIGLPVPASAIIIGSFLWFNYNLNGNYGNAKLALSLVLFLAFLMISSIPFGSFPKLSFRSGAFITIRTITLFILIILFIFYGGLVLFPTFMFYLFTYIISWMVNESPKEEMIK